MLQWAYYYITSEPPAWINYSSPCHNTEDALITTDSSTRQCNKWQGENTHQSPRSLWLRLVTAEREHLQMRRVSLCCTRRPHECFIFWKQPSAVWESAKIHSAQLNVCWVQPHGFHNEPWWVQRRRRRTDVFSYLFNVFQGYFIPSNPHQLLFADDSGRFRGQTVQNLLIYLSG